MGVEIKRWLRQDPSAAIEKIKWNAAKDWANHTEIAAKRKVRVYTGRLRDSITNSVYRGGVSVVGEVWPKLRQEADWEEYGTGVRRKGGIPGSGFIAPIRAEFLVFPFRGHAYDLPLVGGYFFARSVKGKKGSYFMREAKAEGKLYWKTRKAQMQQEIRTALKGAIR